MGSKLCPDCEGSGLVAPPGVEEPIDCDTCGTDGWIVVEDDEDE
ncbi:hypothetical protein [Streptomyces sp. NPDC006997]